MSNDILTHVERGVMTITLNRLDRKNSITAAMYAAMADALATAESDASVRVAVLQGHETVFSAGNDIGDFLNKPPAGQDSPVFRFLRGIATFPKPLLAAVCGPAVGVGTTMLFHCDLVYAGDNAAFSMPFVNLGLWQSRRAVDWSWGHQHQMFLENQTLGQSDIGLVQWLFNRGGYQVGGGGDIVNATKWDASAEDDAYQVTAAPSMRMVVSLEDLDDSRWVNLTGVSGHAFHDNYVDQTELWVEGETLPWLSSREALEEAAEHTLRIVPRG